MTTTTDERSELARALGERVIAEAREDATASVLGAFVLQVAALETRVAKLESDQE